MASKQLDELVSRLGGLDVLDRWAIGARTQLRLLPQMGLGEWRGKEAQKLLNYFRKCLAVVSSTSGKDGPLLAESWLQELDRIEIASADMRRHAAASAANSAYFATRWDAVATARAAADAASLAEASKVLISDLEWQLSEVKNEIDAIHSIGAKALMEAGLWQAVREENRRTDYWSVLNKEVLLTDECWSFWREWYQGFLDGKPLDWELQKLIALIPDAEWEKGPERIAELIEEIRLKYRTAVAPRLVRDDDSNVFKMEDEALLDADTLEFACKRIEGALANALESSGQNGLRDDSYETITVRRGLDLHNGNASLLSTTFFDACLSFQETIGDRYPDDAALINLRNALYSVVEEINEKHPEARARCARLATLAQPKPITQEDRDEIALIPNEIGTELDSLARKVLESDVEIILSQENPPKSVIARLTNWVTTVSGWIDKTQKGEGRAKWLADVIGRFVRWWSGGDGA